MDSEGQRAPLLVFSEHRKRKNHAKDVHILSSAFLFIFSAYGATQNLQSTVNTEQGLGAISMGILYLSLTFFSVFSSEAVRRLGSKNSLVLGTTGYLFFMASNLKPSWYTMVPASFYLGFTASLLWVGQGTYLTLAARCHAKDWQLNEGSVIGNFNGEFWGFFASQQVIGNLISLFLLNDGTVISDYAPPSFRIPVLITKSLVSFEGNSALLFLKKEFKKLDRQFQFSLL